MGPKSVQIPLDIAHLVAESAEPSDRMHDPQLHMFDAQGQHSTGNAAVQQGIM